MMEPVLAVSKGLVYDCLESAKRDGLWRCKARSFYAIASYKTQGSASVLEGQPVRFLKKDTVVEVDSFKKTKTVRFSVGDDGEADIRLVT